MSNVPRSFAGELEGYAANYMRKHGWKIKDLCDHDDAMQEAYLVFRKLDERYPDVVPKHFMALFKTSLERRVINLAEQCTLRRAYRARSGVGDQEDGDFTDQVAGALDGDGYLKRLCDQAPAEIKMVLNLFLSAPTELLEAATGAWRAGGHRQACENEHISKLLGLPPGSKPVDAVKEYFS